MALGTGILLLAVGAILAFAVHVTLTGVSLVAVGYILMAAGAIGVLLDLFLFGPRRRTGRRVTVADESAVPYGDGYPAAGRRRTYSEHTVDY